MLKSKRERQERTLINIENSDASKKGDGTEEPEAAPKQPDTNTEPEASGGEKQPEDAKRVKELEERVLRLQAEFENYKKRAARENEKMKESVSAAMLLKLLPIVDEFEIGISHMDHAPAKDFKRGMELIYAKLKDLLKKEGLEEMNALAESFDPYKHDAIRHGEGGEGKVVEVVQKGYILNGKVLRHAKVVVGKGKEG